MSSAEPEALSLTKKPGRKHVLRACLECRRRHFKCDGTMPVCNQCSKRNRECVFVESHRGGSRKKGVRKDKAKVKQTGVPDIEDMEIVAQTKEQIKQENDQLLTQIYKLPCAKDRLKCKLLDCPGKDVVSGRRELDEATATQMRKRIRLEHSVKQLDCMLLEKTATDDDITKAKLMEFELQYLNPANLIDVRTINHDDIVQNYYRFFHNRHPVLPPLTEIQPYLDVAPELLLILKIVGDGQLLSLYSKDVTLIQDRLMQVCNVVKTSAVKDIISVQVLLLLLVVAHISSLHQLGRKFREACIHLLQELEIHNLDNLLIDQAKLPLFKLSRVAHIPQELIADLARRLIWETYFLDVIIGSADGRTLSNLAKIDIATAYPLYPPREVFDYRGRAEATLLVVEAVKLNLEIMNKLPFETTIGRLKAELSNWELKLQDPQMFGCPPLILKTGEINEGVHQLTLMFNYAKIFVHRPFLYLWKINSPQNPQCGDETLEAKDMPTQLKADARATIETRKTIEAATLVVELLIDTNSAHVLERTPLFACALALAALVHISAYIWIETILDSDDDELVKESGLGVNELDVYVEYIKLALTAIYPISRHWILSGKVAKHIRDSLQALRPELYDRLKHLLPQLEVALDQMQVLDAHANNPSGSEFSNLVVLSLQVSPLNSHLSPHSSITPNSLTPSGSTKGYINVGEPDVVEPMAPPAAITPNPAIATVQELFLLDTNHLVNQNDDGLFEFNSWDWEPAPATNSGCDWIDRALLDYFEGEKPTNIV